MKTLLIICSIVLMSCAKEQPKIIKPPTFYYYSLHHRWWDGLNTPVGWQDSMKLYYKETGKYYRTLKSGHKGDYIMPIDTAFIMKIDVRIPFLVDNVTGNTFPIDSLYTAYGQQQYARAARYIDTARYINISPVVLEPFVYNETRKIIFQLVRIYK